MKFYKKYTLLISFLVAMILHAIIVVFFFQFNAKNPYLTTFNPANVIPVTIGGSGSQSKINLEQKIIKRRNRFGNLTGVKLNQTTIIKTGKISGDGAGDEITSTGLTTQSLISGTVNFDENIISYARPQYPKLALRRGIEGNVTIRLGVTPEGLPLMPKVIKSSGHESLDTAALDATANWRFQKHSSSELIFVEKTVVFKLNK